MISKTELDLKPDVCLPTKLLWSSTKKDRGVKGGEKHSMLDIDESKTGRGANHE